jgi:hypothetical protein
MHIPSSRKHDTRKQSDVQVQERDELHTSCYQTASYT